jgi:hypothetical protein
VETMIVMEEIGRALLLEPGIHSATSMPRCSAVLLLDSNTPGLEWTRRMGDRLLAGDR